jgi:hypothetical protein
MQLICEKLLIFLSKVIKLVAMHTVFIHANIYSMMQYFFLLYFPQSLETGLQINVEKMFSYGTVGSSFTIFKFMLLFCEERFKKIQFSNSNKH